MDKQKCIFPKWSVGVYIKSLVVSLFVLMLFLLLTGSHNLLNYASHWHKKSLEKEKKKYTICKEKSIRLIRSREKQLEKKRIR